ncbi:MAG: glucose-6-phosphate isomerase, partial [Rhodospirillaceae bacterium]|nr:glucose-6-phosphate isomerase [Rhodospirillaceae bacterium]
MLQQADLDPLLRQCEVARARLAGDLSNGGLSAFALARQSDDLGELRAVAADWRKRFKRVVLFGTGGSSLGARALAALATGPNHGGPELCVPDNLDPDLMAQVLAPDQLAHTGFLVVSKSGGTGETLAQALTAVSAVRAALGPDAPAEHFLGISEPGNGALRQLCATINAPVLDHDPDVGGRFA